MLHKSSHKIEIGGRKWTILENAWSLLWDSVKNICSGTIVYSLILYLLQTTHFREPVLPWVFIFRPVCFLNNLSMIGGAQYKLCVILLGWLHLDKESSVFLTMFFTMLFQSFHWVLLATFGLRCYYREHVLLYLNFSFECWTE